MSGLNAADEPLTLCTSCRVQHVENCLTCGGFGLRSIATGIVPVTAREAHEYPEQIDSLACPECGSDIRGAPPMAQPA